MEPDTRKIWTRPEIRVSVGKLIVESLGVDEANVTADAELIADLGAESIDFLDMSFKCQQTFGVDLPMRLIQEHRIEWRDLSVLARVLEERYRVTIGAEELRMVSPATVGAVLEHMAAKHGIARVPADEHEVAEALVARMLADLAPTPLDLSDLRVEQFTAYLEKSLHSPEAVEVLMSRLTVRAVTDYLVEQLAAAGRLAPGT
jgi:acyl carrier protein